MNPEMPPLPFQAPDIRRRRRQRQPVPPLVPLTSAQRSEVAHRVIAEKAKVERKFRELSLEQQRAVILKLKHDRPLELSDLRGTDLRFFGEPGDDESLVYPRNTNLDRLANRAQEFEAGNRRSLVQQPGLLTKLTEIDIADPMERMSDEFRRRYDTLVREDHVIYEIEISATEESRDSAKRREVESIVNTISNLLGRGINGSVYDIDYQGAGAILMVWTTGQILQEWVESAHWWRKISRFELRPRFQTMYEVFREFNVGNITIIPPPENAEIICVIDSGVAIGNPFLQHVTKADHSRSWVYGASPNEDAHGHGSGVGSLAAYHSISFAPGDQNRASAWLTSARIMTDNGELDSPRRNDPIDDRAQQAWLLSNILREVVAHFVPLGVKIFVLAFEMQGHIWSHATRRQVARNAWIARTLDQLSRQYDVVFVGITGNLAVQEVEEIEAQTQQPYPQYLTTPFAKLLDPGPSALGVICGSIAHSTHLIGADHSVIAAVDAPSPFTRSGPGFADSIKPDFVEYGGSLVRHVESNRIVSNMGTEVVMASNRLTPALHRSRGTSFAAPRIANHIAKISQDCRTIGLNPSATLLRAFLAVSCRKPIIPGNVSAAQALSIIGYGRPDGNDAMLCQGHSVLLYWDGSMEIESTAIFNFHVPPEMVNVGRTRKRITIAVASAPAVQQWGLGEYLGAKLKFWLYRGDRARADIVAQHQRELEEPNVAAGASVEPFQGKLGINLRSEGTLQCDTFEWADHREEYSAGDYTLAVSVWGAATWIRKDQRVVPLSVVVRIEEESGAFQRLYAQVRARIRANA